MAGVIVGATQVPLVAGARAVASARGHTVSTLAAGCFPLRSKRPPPALFVILFRHAARSYAGDLTGEVVRLPGHSERTEQRHAPLDPLAWLTDVNHTDTLTREVEGLARGRHPNKHIEASITHAETKGWRVVAGGRSAHLEGCSAVRTTTPSAAAVSSAGWAWPRLREARRTTRT